MELYRQANEKLVQWKESRDRKPLLIRGARQVGKTTLVRVFSRLFSAYVELNLERESDRALFNTDEVDRIFNSACLFKGVIPVTGSTLLFIDEIQESPKAVQLLRYFSEDLPDLYVVAAGSLLEFALKKVPNFPVGRIDYLYLHPLNFREYIYAVNNTLLKDRFDEVPVEDYAHEVLLKEFHDYVLIGGMPSVVNDYLENKNPSFLNKIYKKLWQSYQDDVEKYARNDTEKKIIRHVMVTAPYEKDRIKFEGFGNSRYRSREVGEALRALDLARLIRLIYPTTSLIPPIITNFKKRPRLQFLDTGMLNQILNLQVEIINLKELDNLYHGKIIQHIIGQELISVFEDEDFKPHFWVRESRDSNAEVDYVFHYGNYIIPIEVKAGKQGTLKSLHQFINNTNHPYAVRIFSGKFSVEKHTTIDGKPYLLMNLPYYLGTKLREYVKYFVDNFQL